MIEIDAVRLGRREQKRQETMQRIATTGLMLFVQKGYEQTTLDEIAAAAGIARRTFFHYFKSKEDVLLAYMDGGGFPKALRANLLVESRDQAPLLALQNATCQTMAVRETAAATEVDRLLHSTEALRARLEAGLAATEQIVFETLCEMWPEREPVSLRITAMAGIGAMRIAKEAWRRDNRKSPLANYLDSSFAALKDFG